MLRRHTPANGLPAAGARSDSYYEYLLKQWLLTGKSEGWLLERYVQAMQGVRSRCGAPQPASQLDSQTAELPLPLPHLLAAPAFLMPGLNTATASGRLCSHLSLCMSCLPAHGCLAACLRAHGCRLLMRTAPAGRPGLWYVAEQDGSGRLSGKMDHLVCFLPGLLALGDFHGVSTAAVQQQQQQQDGGSGGGGAGSSSSQTAEAGGATGAAGAMAEDAGSNSIDAGAAAASSADGSLSLGPGKEQQRLLKQKQKQRRQQRQQHTPETGAVDMPDLQLAAELALTCYEMYRRSPAGLAPEIAHFANNTGGVVADSVRLCGCMCLHALHPTLLRRAVLLQLLHSLRTAY